MAKSASTKPSAKKEPTTKKAPAKKALATKPSSKAPATKVSARGTASKTSQSEKEKRQREQAAEQLRQADKALATVQKREARLSQKLSFDAQRARNVKRSIRTAEADLDKLGARLEEARETRKDAKKRLNRLKP